MDASTVRQAFDEAAQLFLDTAAEVTPEGLDAPGLGVWTVRDLIGHTARSFVTIETYVPQGADAVDVPSAAHYYAAVEATANDAAAVAQRGRDATAGDGEGEGTGDRHDAPAAQLHHLEARGGLPLTVARAAQPQRADLVGVRTLVRVDPCGPRREQLGDGVLLGDPGERLPLAQPVEELVVVADGPEVESGGHHASPWRLWNISRRRVNARCCATRTAPAVMPSEEAVSSADSPTATRSVRSSR